MRRQELDHIVESAAQPSQRGSRHPLMVHTFLDFELDEELRELRCLGAPGATQGRGFDLIAFLLRARDRVVSRDELMDALWQGNLVSDAAISQVIMLARKALRDEGESQRVIKTVRGHGVRFVAGVESRERKSEPPLSPVLAPELVEREVREPLLGRSSELRTLLERLGRAELGEGSLVLIEGEPGVGKTTLAEQLAKVAQERGFEVIWGRAWEGGGAPPFWPWIQVLRAIAQREGAERLAQWLGGGGLELLPELGSVAQPRLDALSQDLDGARARFRQFDVLSRLLRHLCGRGPGTGPARKRPWLILLDDLHAADDASVQLVRFLMPDLGELGLLLVGTYRGPECANKDVLGSLVEDCGDNTLHLRGLGPAEVAELLSRKLGQPAHSRLAAAFHSVSAGNPLFYDRSVPQAQQTLLRGEDLLHRPEQTLRSLAAWLGVETDDDAISAMMHPERSVYASFGPPGASYGADPHFLQSPAFRPLSDPSWIKAAPEPPGKRTLLPEVARLASELGYEVDG